ncbi:hypothetical protein E4695_08630 [Alcaligenaceae bacterium 429]|nr:hypothetical protein E4695_08630 [Alcaligenaceae bacterium 429]
MDWKEIALLAVFLLFSVLMAHGWPEGDWQLGWGAIGAIGTFVTGFAAVRISQKQASWMEEKKKISARIIEGRVLPLIQDLRSPVWFLSMQGYRSIGYQDFLPNVVSSVLVIENIVLENFSRLHEIIDNMESNEISIDSYEEMICAKRVFREYLGCVDVFSVCRDFLGTNISCASKDVPQLVSNSFGEYVDRFFEVILKFYPLMDINKTEEIEKFKAVQEEVLKQKGEFLLAYLEQKGSKEAS